MTIRGKILAAAAVPVMAVGVALTAGGSAHAAGHMPPMPIGYSITATNAYSDSISDITATFGPNATSLVGTGHLVPTTSPIQFGATDSLGAPITWSLASPSPGVALTPTGTLTLPLVPVLFARTLTVYATHGSTVAVATVHVTGVFPSSDAVLVTPDTVVLNAPVNSDGMIFFPTVPPGVSETLANGPAGAVFSGGWLSAGTAVPGVYPSVTVTATDTMGATAVDTFDAVVSPVYAPVPRLYGGHAVSVGPTRENVYFIQAGAPSWDHFTIVGPGAINGHQGWVDGQLGLNVAVYGGLEAHHAYTVYFQPVTGQGSTTPIPGSRGGHVFFITH